MVKNWYHIMPVITVAMFSGRTQKEKDRFAEAITDETVKILGVKREDIIIVFQEAPHGNWYASGVRL
jgi:4-oxalocrotonate tautomerase